MKNLWYFLAVIAIVSCNANQEESTPTDDTGIVLNDGEKWAVNEEMKPFIQDAHDILKEYIASDNSDYETLAKDLKEKNLGLIKSCTMKGQSHDELHKWLYPHIELLTKLEKAETTEAANEIIEDLKGSFGVYHTYFE